MPITRSLSLAVALVCASPRLTIAQQQFTLEQVLDEVHDFLLWRNWVSAYRAAEDFLGRRLKTRATAVNTVP